MIRVAITHRLCSPPRFWTVPRRWSSPHLQPGNRLVVAPAAAAASPSQRPARRLEGASDAGRRGDRSPRAPSLPDRRGIKARVELAWSDCRAVVKARPRPPFTLQHLSSSSPTSIQLCPCGLAGSGCPCRTSIRIPVGEPKRRRSWCQHPISKRFQMVIACPRNSGKSPGRRAFFACPGSTRCDSLWMCRCQSRFPG